MASERVCAEARLRKRKDKNRTGIRGDIPDAVPKRLGAKDGDVLVFEEGNTFVAERAAVRGPYFVVTIRRALTAAKPVVTSPVSEEPKSESDPEALSPGGSLKALVRKKLGERGR